MKSKQGTESKIAGKDSTKGSPVIEEESTGKTSNVSIVSIGNGFRVKSFWLGSFYASILLLPDDKETLAEANEKYRLLKIGKRNPIKQVEEDTTAVKSSGSIVELTIQQIIAKLKEGVRVYTPGGTLHSLKYNEAAKDKSVVRKVIIK